MRLLKHYSLCRIFAHNVLTELKRINLARNFKQLSLAGLSILQNSFSTWIRLKCYFKLMNPRVSCINTRLLRNGNRQNCRQHQNVFQYENTHNCVHEKWTKSFLLAFMPRVGSTCVRCAREWSNIHIFGKWWSHFCGNAKMHSVDSFRFWKCVESVSVKRANVRQRRRNSREDRRKKSVLNIFNDTCRCIMRPTHCHALCYCRRGRCRPPSQRRRRCRLLHGILWIVFLVYWFPVEATVRERARTASERRWRRSINVYTNFFASSIYLCLSLFVLFPWLYLNIEFEEKM